MLQKMASISEYVTNSNVKTKNALSVTLQFEPLHLSLSLASWLMSILRPVVRLLFGVVYCLRQHASDCGRIAS